MTKPTVVFEESSEATLLRTLTEMAKNPDQGGEVLRALQPLTGAIPDLVLQTDWSSLYRAWRGERADFQGLREVRRLLECLSERSITFGEGYEPERLLDVMLLYRDPKATDAVGIRIIISGYAPMVLGDPDAESA